MELSGDLSGEKKMRKPRGDGFPNMVLRALLLVGPAIEATPHITRENIKCNPRRSINKNTMT